MAICPSSRASGGGAGPGGGGPAMEPIEGRRREILRIVIDDYIATAEPIGSEAVRERHGLNVSSATVRNEMAALEDMGYLNQPHTSAGRVPTDRGYRVYVDSLVTEEALPSAEQTRLRQTLFIQEEPHLAMARVAQALAAGTEYASVVEAPHLHEQVIRHLHLIPLTPRRALIVVVTDAGVFEGKTVEMQAATSPGATVAWSSRAWGSGCSRMSGMLPLLQAILKGIRAAAARGG